jgi:thiamine-monophosphate kinase
MMDLSDGLSTDLTRLCKASGVGARIQASRLPMVDVPRPLARRGIKPLQLALHGGEDYQLLFTVPPRLAGRVPAKHGGVAIAEIGELVPGRGIELLAKDGKSGRLAAEGWDHFGGRA